jgi:hypothetical protein
MSGRTGQSHPPRSGLPRVGTLAFIGLLLILVHVTHVCSASMPARYEGRAAVAAVLAADEGRPVQRVAETSVSSNGACAGCCSQGAAWSSSAVARDAYEVDAAAPAPVFDTRTASLIADGGRGMAPAPPGGSGSPHGSGLLALHCVWRT